MEKVLLSVKCCSKSATNLSCITCKIFQGAILGNNAHKNIILNNAHPVKTKIAGLQE